MIEYENGIFINKKPICSLSEYIRAINEVSNHKSSRSGENLWFRGHLKESFQLIPSIYRPSIWEEGIYNFNYEFGAFKNFKRKCQLVRSTNFEYLHLMQHFGLPTRLLDWTESSLIALFFAICDYKQDEKGNECPNVWLIDLNEFNNRMNKESSLRYFYGDVIDSKLYDYMYPEKDKECKLEYLEKKPIAVLPSYIDNRVISQKSCFILYGAEQKPIEELRSSYNFTLGRITIKNDESTINDILIDLSLSGINYHSIYPDLCGLVLETKKIFRMKIK